MSLEKTDIDVAMNSFIAEAQKEFAYDDGIEAAPATLAPETPTPEVVPQENTLPVPEPAVDRGLERLVAREVELRERENKLSGSEREVEALRARLRELEPRAISQELLDKIKFSPQDGLRALGLDPDEVVRMALVEKLGDKANDPETRALLERSKIRKEMDALRAKVQEAEYKQAAQAYFAQVQHGAAEFTRNIEGASKNTPTVNYVAKSNPERVFQEIMEEITRDASIRAAREPNGDIMSYAEAAQRVEQRWAAMKSLFTGSLTPEAPKPATPASIAAPKTIVEAKPDVKNPPSTIKPPEKPLAPWLQRSQDSEEAIRAAIAEYKRSESQG